MEPDADEYATSPLKDCRIPAYTTRGTKAGGRDRLAVYFEDIATLASVIRGRAVGSADERRAAQHVSERLREMRIPATTLTFKTPRSWAPPYAAAFALLVIGVLAASVSEVLGLVVSLMAITLLLITAAAWTRVSPLLPSVESPNVVGLILPRSAKQGSSPRGLRRLVLSAHLDTARSGWIWTSVLTRWLRSLALLAFAAAVVILLLQIVALFVVSSIPWILSLIPALIALAVAVLLVQMLVGGVPVAGANDDASGVAVVLAVAEALRKARAENLETWILFTGAKEAGLTGMSAFLTENQFDPDTTYFINVDSVGAGYVRYTFEEGLFLPRRSSPVLGRIAGNIARKEPKWQIEPAVNKLLPTDQLVALARGYQAIGVTARDADGLIPHWHQTTDTIDQIDSKTTETTTEFILAMIRRLDEEMAGAVHLAARESF